VIRLVSLDPLDPEVLQKLTRVLFQAYGLGCEHVGEMEAPASALRGESIDAVEFLKVAPEVKSFADDKVLFLTGRALSGRELPSGKGPTPGFSLFGGPSGIVTAHGLPKGDGLLKRLAKQAVHELGHLWELHHCLDPRCAMYAPWAPAFANGEPTLCTFCREKSEGRIRLAKT
jgi:archaemetzincin